MVEPEQAAASIVPEEASRKLDAALKNVPAEEREPIRRVFRQSIERSFQAPYPPPEMIPEYERYYPDFLKTLVDRSYEAQQHAQDMERLSIEGPLKYAQRGQVLGALIVLGGIGGAIVCAVHGQVAIGVTLGLAAAAPIVGHMVRNPLVAAFGDKSRTASTDEVPTRRPKRRLHSNRS